MNARTMWIVQNGKHFAFSLSREGAITLKHIHAERFKYARVRSILQMWPDKITLGAVYNRATRARVDGAA